VVQNNRAGPAEADKKCRHCPDRKQPETGRVITVSSEIGIAVMRVDANQDEEHLDQQDRDRDDPDCVKDLSFDGEGSPPNNHAREGAKLIRVGG